MSLCVCEHVCIPVAGYVYRVRGVATGKPLKLLLKYTFESAHLVRGLFFSAVRGEDFIKAIA